MTAGDWDEAAADFDREPDHGLGDPDVRAAWAELLASWLPAAADIADLGCGTGSVSVLLAEQGHRVTGVDFSPAMVDQARAKASRHRVEVDFRVGDAGDPGLAAASYDVVLTRHVLWALPDQAAAVQRWAGLLRPGGRFVLVEGRWFTGSGLDAGTVTALVAPHTGTAAVHDLDDPLLWGREIDDHRYAVIATVPGHRAERA